LPVIERAVELQVRKLYQSACARDRHRAPRPSP
jgi:hypothetical protein